MSKNKELLKNTIVIFLGKFSTQFLSFFLLPLYTSLLSTEAYGTIDLLFTYVGLLVPVITIQLESALFRYLIDCKKSDGEKRSKIYFNVISTSLMLLAIFLVAYFALFSFLKFTYKYELILVITVTIFSNLFLQGARGDGDNNGYSIGCVISGTLNILFNILFLRVLSLGAKSLFYANILSNLACVLFLFFRLKVYRTLKFKNRDIKLLKNMASYSLPLIPNGIIWWIIGVSDRTILTIIKGAAANGIYAVSNKFSMIIMSVYNVFNLSWTESISRHIDDPDKDAFFNDIFNKVINLSALICFGIITVIPFIFPIFIGANYSDSYIYIPYLIVGSFFNMIVSFLGSFYIAIKKTKEVAKTSFFAGIINIVVNLLLVNTIGIWAAIISTIVAFGTMTIYRIIDIKKYIDLKLSLGVILKTIVYFVFFIGIFSIGRWYLDVLNLLIYLVIAFFTLKPSILNFIKKRKPRKK